MTAYMYIFAGGGAGAVSRYAIGQWAATGLPRVAVFGGAVPLGTLICNIIGGLAMGVLAGYVMRSDTLFGMASGDAQLLIGVGLLGGFTTFSAFSLESMHMLQSHHIALFATYSVISVLGSIAALALGLAIARAFAQVAT